mmetsp:Transcript_37957/g.94048  ORF Transcript_37957/g.94048 Transcript_37957/m.94048 type:complete len:228 (+) Transcript_37957:51-734(+)
MLVWMVKSEGCPAATSMSMGDRHLANSHPAFLYSAQRAARESRPCITVAPDWPGRAYTFRWGLTPVTMPASASTLGKSSLLVLLRWYSVSGSRIAAERYLLAPGYSKSTWRYARRFSSVFSTPTASKRCPIVPGPSSQAVMPLPGVPIMAAIFSRWAFSSAERKAPPWQEPMPVTGTASDTKDARGTTTHERRAPTRDPHLAGTWRVANSCSEQQACMLVLRWALES